MRHYCSDCDNLDVKGKTKPKANGQISGCRYYCKKQKTYVDPTMEACPKFAKCYGRTSRENEKIYEDGKSYYNDKTPIWFYGLVLLILVILGLILGVFK